MDFSVFPGPGRSWSSCSPQSVPLSHINHMARSPAGDASNSSPSDSRLFLAYFHKSALLFDLPYATSAQLATLEDPEQTGDFVRSITGRWRRCAPLILFSFAYVLSSMSPRTAGATRFTHCSLDMALRLLILVMALAPAIRADPLLYNVVVLGLATTLNATLVTLAFIVISKVARRLDGAGGERATHNFIKVSRAFSSW